MRVADAATLGALRAGAEPARVDVPLTLSPRAIEAIKWVALISMTVDHANLAVLGRWLEWGNLVGRFAFPLFAFLVGWNLARADAAGLDRAMRRFAMAALVSQPAFVLLTGQAWWQGNVMFTFLAAAGVIRLARCAPSPTRNTGLAIAFLLAGPFVDYQWAGIALVLASHAFAKRRSSGALAVLVAVLGGMAALLSGVIGPTAWAALGATPIVWLATTRAAPPLPRLRWFFYFYYPAHMAVIAWLARLVWST